VAEPGLELTIDSAPRTASVPNVWRRSWLCRRRHNYEYADLLVMPTWSRKSSQIGLMAA
jgi:hypothetical protein